MIIVKKDERVYLAYSISVYSGHNNEFFSEKSMLLKDNLFFFKLNGNDSVIMGSGYDMAGVDIVRYRKDIAPENKVIDDEYFYFDFRRKMDEIIQENSFMLDKDGDLIQDYFVAHGDKAYLYCDNKIYYIKDVYSCRTGNNCLKWLNEKYPDIPIEKLLFMQGNAVEESDRKCMFPMIYTDTISRDVKLLKRDGSVEFLYKL